MTWRLLFWIAAAFNVAVGLPLLAAPALLLEILGAAPPADLSFHRLAGLLIICFGCIYAFVARDQQRYRPLLWLAVAGKLGVVAIFAFSWLEGIAPLRAFALSLGDLAFGLTFLLFLLTTRPRATA